MNCNNFINQQPSSLPVSGRFDFETKTKDLQRQRRGKKSHEAYMKKLKEKLLKDHQKRRLTLKEFIDYFQQVLNDPASILMAIEETMRIMKEEHNTEMNISIRGTEHALVP